MAAPDDEPGSSRRAAPPRLSVVVPTYNAAATLTRCLDAVRAAVGPDDEVIVADDGTTDGSVDGVASDRVRVVSAGRNIGRGPVRNLGAAQATGDVLVFVDADVELHLDALDRVRQAFEDDPHLVALIGSYDDHPGAAGIVSQYRNLLHHHTHHTHGTRATHFWTGVGAVRREVFEALGGLDENRWARDMEDVEFGHRLRAAGHEIVVRTDIEGRHLKPFTVRSMVRTDLFSRAIPWSTLILQNRLHGDTFVTSWPQIVSVASASLLVVASLTAIILPAAAWVALAALAAFVASNWSLWRFLRRTMGVLGALASLPLHLLHALASAVGFAVAVVRHGWHRLLRRSPDAPPR